MNFNHKAMQRISIYHLHCGVGFFGIKILRWLHLSSRQGTHYANPEKDWSQDEFRAMQ
jgi:hypothetical protein